MYEYTDQRGKTWPDWDKKHYLIEAERAVRTYLDGYTPTYKGMEAITKYWLEENPEPRKALMFVITDGEPYPTNGRRQDILNYVSVAREYSDDSASPTFLYHCL